MKSKARDKITGEYVNPWARADKSTSSSDTYPLDSELKRKEDVEMSAEKVAGLSVEERKDIMLKLAGILPLEKFAEALPFVFPAGLPENMFEKDAAESCASASAEKPAADKKANIELLKKLRGHKKAAEQCGVKTASAAKTLAAYFAMRRK
jgi:hypothetical protein